MTPREIYFARIHGIHERAAVVLARLGIRDVYRCYNAEMQRMNILGEMFYWDYWDYIFPGEKK